MPEGVGMPEEGWESGGLGQRVARLEQDVRGIKADTASLKADVAALQGDVATLKGDVAALKGDIVEIKVALARIEGRLTGINDRFGHIPTILQLGGFVSAVFLAAGVLRWVDRPTVVYQPAPVAAPR